MDFFQHRYYKLNRTLVLILGIWPYQRPFFGLTLRLVLYAIVVSYTIPTVIAIVENYDDREFLLQSSTALLLMAVLCAKYISSRLKLNQLLQLLERIRMDWKVWARHREVNILHEYADQGRKMTVLYAVMLYTTCIIFSIPSFMPKMIDVLLRNGSKPGGFPFPVDYHFFDMQKYYFYVLPHSLMCVSVGYVVAIANDTMFILCVQHGCGIFAALGHKLERIGRYEGAAEVGDKMAYGLDEEKMDIELLDFELAWCIDRHNDAIEYAEIVESIYSWSLFIVLGCNMVVISITGLQIINASMESNDTATPVVRNMMSLVHLYFQNYLCQIMMDHSIRIRYCIYNGKWYRLSLQAQKGLYLMIMRSNVPCKLTAGTIYIMSMENFAVIVKTSMSFLTVLRTMQEPINTKSYNEIHNSIRGSPIDAS